MFNISAKVEGKTLTLVVDLSKELGPSSSGKTIIIASTQGNAPLPPNGPKEIRFGLNVYKGGTKTAK